MTIQISGVHVLADDTDAARARLADAAEIAAAMGLAPEVRRIAEATARLERSS